MAEVSAPPDRDEEADQEAVPAAAESTAEAAVIRTDESVEAETLPVPTSSEESNTVGFFHRAYGVLLKATNALGVLGLGGLLFGSLVVPLSGAIGVLVSEILGLWVLGSLLCIFGFPAAVWLPRSREDQELHSELAISTPATLTLLLTSASTGAVLLFFLLLLRAAFGS